MDYLNLAFQFAVRIPGVIFTFGCVYFLVLLCRSLRMGLASKNWPNVRGIVKESSVEEKSESEGGVIYRPKIIYSYRVDDCDYESDRSFSWIRSGWRKRVANIVERYPQGSDVEVYFNPDNPSQAVLERGITPSSYIVGFGVCLIGLIAGIMFCLAPWLFLNFFY
jgi:hypothetical protein